MNVRELQFEVSEDLKTLIPEQKLTSIIQAFTQLDANQDHKIELNEYLNFALAKEKSRLVQKFLALDTDNDGCIDVEEFAVASEPTIQILKKF
jgi:Ca2+-binding EF-hand superfamily protein